MAGGNEMTPEECRRLIVDGLEHAGMAGAFADTPAALRARLLAAKDWLRGLDLGAAPAATEPEPPTAPTKAEQTKGKRKRA